jgi:hypothetical protein
MIREICLVKIVKIMQFSFSGPCSLRRPRVLIALSRTAVFISKHRVIFKTILDIVYHASILCCRLPITILRYSRDQKKSVKCASSVL